MDVSFRLRYMAVVSSFPDSHRKQFPGHQQARSAHDCAPQDTSQILLRQKTRLCKCTSVRRPYTNQLKNLLASSPEACIFIVKCDFLARSTIHYV
jgi:hypothetical protein